MRHRQFLIVAGVLALSLAWLTVQASERERGLLLGTLKLSSTVVLISVPIGVFVALLIHRTKVASRNIAKLTMSLLLFIPLFLQAAAWEAAIGQRGWLDVQIPGSDEAFVFLTGWRAAVFIHVVAAIPWVVLIVGAGLQSLPREFEEQASLDGSKVRVITFVTLRLISPAILAASLWVAVWTAGEMTVTDLYGVSTYAEELFLGYWGVGDQLIQAEFRALPAITLLTILTTAIAFGCDMLLPRVAVSSSPNTWNTNWRSWHINGKLLVVIGFLALVPVVNLIHAAGLEVNQVGDKIVSGWSATKVVRIVANAVPDNLPEFGYSALLSQLCALSVVVAGIVAAAFAERSRTSRICFFFLAAFCFALPGPIVGLTLIRLLSQSSSEWVAYLNNRTLFAPWLAMSIKAFPFAFFLLYLGVRSLPKSQLESAKLDGAGWLSRLWYISLPQLAPQLIVAWLVATAVSLGDLAMSILVVPPGVSTLSIRVFGWLHAGVDDQSAGICLTLLLIIGAIMFTIGAILPSRNE